MARPRTNSTAPQAKVLMPLEAGIIKILLLENVNAAAVQMLRDQGYEVTEVKSALGEDEVIARLKEGAFQAVGIRSKTRITARVIQEVPSVRRLVVVERAFFPLPPASLSFPPRDHAN